MDLKTTNITDWSAGKVIGALLALQEAKKLFSTGDRLDGIILSDLIRRIQNKKPLTASQLDTARMRLKKYKKYLQDLDFKDYVMPTKSTALSTPLLKMHNPSTFRLYIDSSSYLFQQACRCVDIQWKFKRDYQLCPATKNNAHRLINLGFLPENRVLKFLDLPEKKLPKIKKLKGLLLDLLPYQQHGLSFLLDRNGRAILADEMGLGKTIQAIAYCLAANQQKILVICPASVKMTWRKEIMKCIGIQEAEKIVVLSGKKPTQDLALSAAEAKWIIINYDVLSGWVDTLKKLKITCALADECHNITAKTINYRKASQRAKATLAILKKIAHLLFISGTPIENRPSEFYSLINMVDPYLFPRKLNYQIKYCDGKQGRYGWEAKGASNQKELFKILSDTIMIRRLKKEVLKELPDKRRVAIPVELPAKFMKEYKKIETSFETWLKQNYTDEEKITSSLRGQAFAQKAVLRQKIALAKVPFAIEWIDNYLETESKLVVFAHHKVVIQALQEHYKKRCVVIDGSVKPEKRQDIVDEFQENSKINLFIGNLQAAHAGLTLTAAKDTLTLELGWTSSKHDQAEDRVHRIGQKNAVTAFYMLALNTIDVSSLASTIDFKRDNLSQILDGTEVAFGDSLLDTFLQNTLEEQVNED